MPRKAGLSRLHYVLFATPLDEMIVPSILMQIVDTLFAFLERLTHNRRADIFSVLWC
ncbi:MAG: hypothetical protein SFV22_04320 [Saprospiraceae bacterium]|nr:hypothetical protein [Saprospiraceae bacterium]